MNRPQTGGDSKNFMPLIKTQPVKLTRKNVKLCDLCGSLNLDVNKECWTCRWHGGFSRNEQVIALAWQRLEVLYEEVRIEHVTARRSPPVGDFGAARPASWHQKITHKLAASWQRFSGSA